MAATVPGITSRRDSTQQRRPPLPGYVFAVVSPGYIFLRVRELFPESPSCFSVISHRPEFHHTLTLGQSPAEGTGLKGVDYPNSTRF